MQPDTLAFITDCLLSVIETLQHFLRHSVSIIFNDYDHSLFIFILKNINLKQPTACDLFESMYNRILYKWLKQ